MESLVTIEERRSEARPAQTPVESLSSFPASHGERHYSVSEVAALWSLSRDSVRRIFRREPGTSPSEYRSRYWGEFTGG
jgi:transcriptional regulator GlxA family with amidase domain